MFTPVQSADARLQADYPHLHAAVRPWFSDLARRAVTRAGGIEPLHGPLSLLTAIDAVDSSPTLDPILRAVDGQVPLVAHVPGVAGLHQRLAQCGRGSLLSAMSELTFACHLLQQGAALRLDHPFEVVAPDGRVARNDADILATWGSGAAVFDVYSPHHDDLGDDFCGWFAPTMDGFAEAVEKKVTRKFGGLGAVRRGLPPDSAVVLAVDVTYHDDAARALFLRPGVLGSEMRSPRLAQSPIDGVLVFRHAQGVLGHPVEVRGMLRVTDRVDDVCRRLGIAPVRRSPGPSGRAA